jgi:hypothetical protein
MRCPTPRNGHPCHGRRCPECGRLWAGDWRISLHANWESYDGQVQLVTVTAPGADVLPWDTAQCDHPANVNCSGRLGCTIEAGALEAWNGEAQANWTRMHRTIAQKVRRKHPRQLHVLGYVWQLQKRGALHIHVVLGLKTPVNRHAARLYQLELAAASHRYGFGNVDRKMSSAHGHRVAAYLSSYLIVGKGGKASVQEAVSSPQAPPRIVYMARFLTQATGLTMRQLRRRRFLWRLWQQRQLALVDEHLVDVFTGEVVAPSSVLRL